MMSLSTRAFAGLLALALPASLCAQSRGAWAGAGATYQTALSTPTLGGFTLLGATFGHGLGSRTGVALSFAQGTGLVQPAAVANPSEGTAWVPPSVRRDHLDVSGELRYRVNTARDLDRSELYLVFGGGVMRSHLGDESSVVAPQTHAGLGMTFPFGEAMGLEFRAMYVASQLRPQDIGTAPTFAPGASVPSYGPAAWVGSVRAGVSFFLRPVARPRRIPPQYVPDATMVPAPTTSYEGMFLRRDSVAAVAAAEGDQRGAGDPDASPGGTIRGEYLTRRTPFTDPDAVIAGRVAPKRASRDTLYALADTVGAIPAADPRPAPVVKASRPAPKATRSTKSPAASRAPTRPAPVPRLPIDSSQIREVAAAVRGAVRDAVVAGVSDGVAEVERTSGAPISATEPRPVVRPRELPARTDSVVSESDAANDYLVIRPVVADGHLDPRAVDRIAALAERFLAAQRTLDFAIVVETSADEASLNETLLEDAYALRATLVSRGVPSAQVLVREVPAGPSPTNVRVLVRSPKLAAR